MAGSTNFPSSVDTFATTMPSKLGTADAQGRKHAKNHEDSNAAIMAIETELGTDPSGASATVRERFESIEANGWVTAARLASRAAAPARPRPALGYFVPNPGSVSNSGAMSYERMYRWPIWLPGPMTIDKCAINVAILGTGVLRLGLYSIADSSDTHTLVADFGTVDPTTAAVKEITGLSVSIPTEGTYLFALAWQTSNSVSPQLSSLSDSVPQLPLPAASTARAGENYYAVYNASVSGAFPATASTVPSSGAIRPPRVVFSRSA